MITIEENEVLLEDCIKCDAFVRMVGEKAHIVECDLGGASGALIPHPRNLAEKGTPIVASVVSCPRKRKVRLVIE